VLPACSRGDSRRRARRWTRLELGFDLGRAVSSVGPYLGSRNDAGYRYGADGFLRSRQAARGDQRQRDPLELIKATVRIGGRSEVASRFRRASRVLGSTAPSCRKFGGQQSSLPCEVPVRCLVNLCTESCSYVAAENTIKVVARHTLMTHGLIEDCVD
jgi:hypothetical protein